jgi:hypothetical protein
MNKKATNQPITKVRREVLESLAAGEMLVVDKTNSTWLGVRDVSQTRYWLVEQKLVERKDKLRKVDALDNGLVISEKGRDLLKAQPVSKNRSDQADRIRDQVLIASVPSERQLEYAKSLGIKVLTTMTFEDVSDQIDCCIERDSLAQDVFKKIATIHNIQYSEFTGCKNLRSRIFRSFSRPTQEQFFVRWFSFFVMLDRKVLSTQDDDVWSKPELSYISEKLKSNQSVINSIRRYADSDLMFFGKQVSNDGVETSGSSRDTLAYKSVVELL